MDEDHLSLRVGHLVMACLHLGVSVYLLLNVPAFYVDMEYVGRFRVGILSGIFLAFASVDHLLCTWLWEEYKGMVEGFEERSVWFRWTEYAFSATIMNIEIALMCGCDSLIWIGAVGLATDLMIQRGSAAEPKKANARGFNTFLSWVFFCVAWSIIFTFYTTHASGAPWFVHVIVSSLFVFESLFGIVFAVASNQVETSDGAFAREWAYLTLSLVSKMSLAVITYMGTRARAGAG
jgi:hypothetical protein